MATGIRIRTSIKGDLTTVQAILKHPMDTGNNRDPETGKMIPAFLSRQSTYIITIKSSPKMEIYMSIYAVY